MSENRKIKFTTNKGVFVAEMFEDKAPLTTKNFIELVEKASTTVLFPPCNRRLYDSGRRPDRYRYGRPRLQD